VERSGEQELQINDGSEQSTEREAAERERSGERGYRNRLEREACFSLQYSVLCLGCRVFDVCHVGSLRVHRSSTRLVIVAVHYPPACNNQVG